MAAHSSSALLSLKLTNNEQASVFWKPGLSPSRYLKRNKTDLSSAFSEVCKKFEFSDLNKSQKEVLTQVELKKKDIFVSLPTCFGKSVIFHALPIVFYSYTGKSGHIVIVVSPLLLLIKDQCKRLWHIGISSISLSDVNTPFSLTRDFQKQNTHRNVSKISVNHACYGQIGSKSTNHSPLTWRIDGLKVTLVAVIGGFRFHLSTARKNDGNFDLRV